MTPQKHQGAIYIVPTNGAGGAEQCLKMLAEVSGGKMICLRQATYGVLPLSDVYQTEVLSQKSFVWGLMLLAKALSKYRKGYVIVSSAVYINSWLGILKHIGFLKSTLVFRESTSIFLRYGGLKKASYQLAYRAGYTAADLIICQTTEMRNQFIEHNPFIPTGKVAVLTNPINLKTVSYKGNNATCDLENDKYLCAAGRLIPVKGFNSLIIAFKKISDDFPDLKLIILGEGPEKDNLLNQIENLRLSDRVILMGFVENPYPYFKNAQACIVSSLKEGFPNVLLQMMVLNNHVLSTRCAGGVETIPGIVTIEPDNTEELASGLKQVLNTKDAGTRYLFDVYLNNRNPELYLKEIFVRLKTRHPMPVEMA